jgi:glycosyltransferase involved in cell wall biosynthesis
MEQVSVLMTVYNDGERFLKMSIQSILSQTYKDFELIIVNDGSTDSTDEIVRDFVLKDHRVKYINRKVNKGRVFSLNEGLENCSGNLIFINDADDISNSRRIEECINYYRYKISDKEKFGVLGTAFISNELKRNQQSIHKIKYGSMLKKKIPMWRILVGMPFPHSSFMYNKNALNKVGGFSAEVTAGIDYLTLLKIANNFDIFGLNHVLVERIVDGQNFFMQKKINDLSTKNSSIINKWQNDNIRMVKVQKIPYHLYIMVTRLRSLLFSSWRN